MVIKRSERGGGALIIPRDQIRMNIREATREDFDQIWPIFHEIAAAGETYAYPRDITKEESGVSN